MMFSSYVDMIYKKLIVLCKTFINHCLSSIGSPRWYPFYENVMSDYISINSEIHHPISIFNKGGKVSQLWVSSCSAQIQWVASSKKSAF